MKHNRKGILIGLLTGAILFVIGIYLPVVTPVLYETNEFVSYNHGVDFSRGIANMPVIKYVDEQYEDYRSEFPTYTPTTANYTVNKSSETKSTTGQTNYTVSTQTRTQPVPNKSVYVPSTLGFFTTLNARKSAQSKPTLQTNGITTLSSDLASSDNSTSRELASTDDPILTDPGDEPTGNPIPVGDGVCILFLMAVGYAFLKFRISKNKIKTNFPV